MRQGGLGAGAALLRGHRRIVPADPGEATASRRPSRRATIAVLALIAAGGVSVIASVALLTRVATPIAAGPAPRFVEETSQSGVDHRYAGGDTFAEGGGMAEFDCNGDGRPELYLSGGAGPAALYRNDSPTGGPLRFTPIADPVTDLGDVTGAYPIDVDGDGNTD